MGSRLSLCVLPQSSCPPPGLVAGVEVVVGVGGGAVVCGVLSIGVGVVGCRCS